MQNIWLSFAITYDLPGKRHVVRGVTGMRTEANPKMRTTGCVNISVRPEHTAQVALPRHSYIFPPELSESPLGVG